MKKEETTNTFNDGLVMDFNPLVTPNNVLTNCLNGTILTFNGNENVLQNDMGNGRIETARLPEGYIPLGTTELGGIIYIVSYNPIIGKSQIGCFPSPERNITSDELSVPLNNLTLEDLFDGQYIKSKFKKLILLDKVLHPGDKFQIGCKQLTYDEANNFISAQEEGNTNSNKYPKYLKLNVVAIQDNGMVNNLNNSLVWHDNNYYILDQDLNIIDGKLDLDEYRKLIRANYNAFDSKVDGKLAILAELECIDNFSVSWDAKKTDKGWLFYFYLNWTYNNQTDPSKINLYGIRVIQDHSENPTDIVIHTYPRDNYSETSDNDILKNKNTKFYTPMLVESIDSKPDYEHNGGILIPRKNDGTDNQFLLYEGIQVNKTEGTVQFDIYPSMPFGYLNWLKQSFSIDINNLGSGKVDLREYRYYYNKKNVILNWGLDTYPERNKKITSVGFHFYEYTEDIGNYLIENASNVQNSYSVSGYWEDETKDTFAFTTDKIYEVTSKTSYSGNFQEYIYNLSDDKLYLVRIVINYNNGEKIYYYYRFLYTCDVFNSYYFSTKDYKYIVLDDAIKDSFKFSADNLVLSNINKTDVCIDNSTGEEIAAFPEFLEEKTIKNYTIKRGYNCDLKFDISSTLPYSSLSAVLQSVGNPTAESNITPTTPTPTTISQDKTKTTVSDLEGFSYIPEHNNKNLTKTQYTENYKLIINSPLKIEYSKQDSVDISYELTKLTVSVAYLIVDGGEKWISLYASEVYVAKADASPRDDYKDDTHSCANLENYPNTYKEILSKLQNCDVLILRFRVYETAETGKEGNYTIWGRGAYQNRDNAQFYYNEAYDTRKGKQDINLIIYCFSDTADKPILTTYGKDQSTGWYGKSMVKGDTFDRPWGFTTHPLTLERTISDEILKGPLDKYYKLSKCQETKNFWEWYKISYYDNFTWTDTINIESSGNVQLYVNNSVLLAPENPILNLQYSKEKTFAFDVNVSNSENFDNWIDAIINTSIGKLTKLPDGSVKTIEIVDRSLYDKFGNIIEYLKQDDGTANSNLIDLKDSEYKFDCDSNHKVKLIRGTPASNKTLHILGRQEEQNIGIYNIIQLNDQQ